MVLILSAFHSFTNFIWSCDHEHFHGMYALSFKVMKDFLVQSCVRRIPPPPSVCRGVVASSLLKIVQQESCIKNGYQAKESSLPSSNKVTWPLKFHKPQTTSTKPVLKFELVSFTVEFFFFFFFGKCIFYMLHSTFSSIKTLRNVCLPF